MVDERIAAHLVFSGIVQGVFFRANTRREALRLGLQGWVRNLPEGTVEAWVEGNPEDIDRLVEVMRTVVPLAQVDRVDREDNPFTGDYTSFEIVR
jgi:acylphosphatase